MSDSSGQQAALASAALAAAESSVPKADEVAIITGSASGIGRSTALAFAALNYRLVLVDKNSDKLAETAKLCLDKSPRQHKVSCFTKQANVEPMTMEQSWPVLNCHWLNLSQLISINQSIVVYLLTLHSYAPLRTCVLCLRAPLPRRTITPPPLNNCYLFDHSH